MPLRDILVRAQRVNRTWRDSIATSPKIQQALFFRPITSDTIRLKAGFRNLRACKDDGECRPSFSLPKLGDQGEDAWTWAKSNEKFEGDFLMSPRWIAGNPDIYARHFVHGIMLETAEESHSPKLQASWQRMLCSQPPVSHTIVDHWTASRHFHIMSASQIDAGITNGDAVESMRAFHTHRMNLIVRRPRSFGLDTNGGVVEVVDVTGFEAWKMMNEAAASNPSTQPQPWT